MLALGTVGLLAELALLEHVGVWQQWLPLALLVAGLAAIGWGALAPSRAAVAAVRWVHAAYLPATAAGLFFHVRANVEWARDGAPDLSGWPLVRDVLFGSLPTLAPGALAQLGLLGLLYAWRHPALGDVPSTTA